MGALSDRQSMAAAAPRAGGARRLVRGLTAGLTAGLLAGALLALAAGADRVRAERAGGAPPAAPAVRAALDVSHPPLDGQWVVVMRAGEVVWRRHGAAEWTSPQTGQVVPAHSEIETGPDGALILVVGGDRLVMAGDSRLILPPRGPGQDQRLHHPHGRLRIDVEPRAGRAVEVRTPLLSLGIKGTSFELVVDRRQNSVLVLAGTVAVTPPDGGRAIDLGPREGWRQAADPAIAPRRLELSDLPLVAGRVEPVRWHLPQDEASSTAPATADTGWSARPVASARAQTPSEHRLGAAPSPAGEGVARPPRETAAAPRRAYRSDRWLGGWLDHQTSLLTILMIAGGGLVILAVPALMLGQSLRQQWRNRPASKGRRRRSMIHG